MSNQTKLYKLSIIRSINCHTCLWMPVSCLDWSNCFCWQTFFLGYKNMLHPVLKRQMNQCRRVTRIYSVRNDKCKG